MLGLHGQSVAVASQQQQQQQQQANSRTEARESSDMMSPPHGQTHQIRSTDSASPEAVEQRKSNATPAAAANNRRVSSPGYHSAASSPDSSVSSLVSSMASSSSGISSTASDNSNQPQQQQPRQLQSSPSNALMMALTNSAANCAKRPFGTQTVSCTTANIANSLQVVNQQQQQQQHQTRASNSAHSNGQQQANLLDYYPDAQQDGLNLSWFHGANSRQSLSKALASRRSIVAGDISLAELSRYPVPIMARPPLGASDLTLEHWLTEVIQARKGIKLTFTSTRTVEPAFRVLARHAEHLKGPIILSADVLARPSTSKKANANCSVTASNAKQQQQQQPVDAWTFLMLCRTRFPKSIISIGWCPSQSASTQTSQGLDISANPAAPTASEPMFELDMMLENCQQQQHVSAQLHMNSNLLNLIPNSSQLGGGSGGANLSSIHMVQQLAAAAAAAAGNSNGHGHSKQQHGSYSVSSIGSLTNSSSGNSSGSPSPTSPMAHHHHHLPMSHQHHNHHQHHQRHLQTNQHHQRTSSAEQLIMAAAAAAAASAADFKSHQQTAKQTLVDSWPARIKHEMIDEENKDQDEHNHHRGHHEPDGNEPDELDNSDDCHQLPLNLNINEADPQHGAANSSAAALHELAKQIKSFRQQQQQQQQQQHAMSSFSELDSYNSEPLRSQGISKRLFSAMSNSDQLNSAQLIQQQHQGDEHRKWDHIAKKTALGGNRLSSCSPSPVAATSPKNQSANNLLCVGQHHQQQVLRQQLAQQARQLEPAGANSTGYTREMIDKMATLVKEYNLTQPITFPVEARLLNLSSQGSGAQNSLGELQRLLHQVGTNSTLTVVAQPEDLISVEDLLTIRKHFATNQILFDLPDQLASLLRHELELR